MSEETIRFVVNAMRNTANNKNSQYWLPKVLAQLKDSTGQKNLLPIKAPEWKVGELSGESGKTIRAGILGGGQPVLDKILDENNIKDDFVLIVHPEKDKEWPKLALTTLVVDGLQNAWVRGDTTVTERTTTYHCVIPVEFGHYQDESTMPKRVEITGNFFATFFLGIADSPPNGLTKKKVQIGKLPQWPTIKMDSTGTFGLFLNGLKGEIEVDLSVSGAGTTRSLAISVTQVKCHSGDKKPVEINDKKFAIDPGSDDFFKKSIKNYKAFALNLLSNPAVAQKLFTELNAVLNAEGNRNQLSKELTKQLGELLDKTLGKVSSGGLYVGGDNLHPVAQYFFDRLRTALNDKESSFFVPATMLSLKNPTMDPYSFPSEINLPDQPITGEKKLHHIKLKNVTMTSASNALFPAAKIKQIPGGLQACLEIGRITTRTQVKVRKNGGTELKYVPDPPLTLKGDFTARIGDSEKDLPGTFNVTIKQPDLDIIANITGKTVSDVTVKFSKLTPSVTLANLMINIEIKSAFKDIINRLVNKDDSKQEVINGTKKQVDQNRDRISERVTEDVRKVLKEYLGD